MGVGAATGLNLPNLYGALKVADIKDPQAAKALSANIIRNAAKTAVNSASIVFYRHQKQITNDRNIALPAGANNGAYVYRGLTGPDLIKIDAVITADCEQIA